MSPFPLFTKYAWIGQGFYSVKEILNHGHSIYGVDWGAQDSCVEILHGNSTKRHIKPNQHMENLHAFTNYVKTTLNHGLSLSEVDLGDLKRETTKHSLMEVDWGGKVEPKYTSSGCMLIQVDWGGKLRVSHINECMPSEVDWGAHETHQNGHCITEVDWGAHDPSLYLWVDTWSLMLIRELMIQFSSFTLRTLIMMQSPRISSPMD